MSPEEELISDRNEKILKKPKYNSSAQLPKTQKYKKPIIQKFGVFSKIKLIFFKFIIF